MKKGLLYTIRPMEPNEIYMRQEIKMQMYSYQNNIEIIEKYSDIGYPASNLKRPALQEMINYVSSGKDKIDIVLFYGLELFKKDLPRIQYVEPIIKRYVKEVLYIPDSMFHEREISERA